MFASTAIFDGSCGVARLSVQAVVEVFAGFVAEVLFVAETAAGYAVVRPLQTEAPGPALKSHAQTSAHASNHAFQ
jgi:hypothetical protein